MNGDLYRDDIAQPADPWMPKTTKMYDAAGEDQVRTRQDLNGIGEEIAVENGNVLRYADGVAIEIGDRVLVSAPEPDEATDYAPNPSDDELQVLADTLEGNSQNGLRLGDYNEETYLEAMDTESYVDLEDLR